MQELESLRQRCEIAEGAAAEAQKLLEDASTCAAAAEAEAAEARTSLESTAAELEASRSAGSAAIAEEVERRVSAAVAGQFLNPVIRYHHNAFKPAKTLCQDT